ncbi:MAG: M48 family metallopeptidase [Phycisphaerales bacterium]|nr:M48 family metallopeptidase [Phycisphaerales bacterium]
MNFFEAQDKAHRKTGLLVWLLVGGLASMTVGMYAILMLVVHVLGAYDQIRAQRATERGESFRETRFQEWADQESLVLWDLDVFLLAFGLMLVLVGGGFLYRYLQLRAGGEAVAEMMGGKRIEPDTSNAHEQRALNVVEEMAIASGVPVPPVYEIPSDAINAFAAGHTVDQAAIGLTRGTIMLPRDELQGIVAHEFSHIFNGDMRLNLRLIAVINGVMVLGIAGLLLARTVAYGMLFGGGGRSSNDKGNGAAIAIGLMVVGWLIAAIGFMGTLVARLIQAAVSRQREFLADASAVQFTRNPDGIAGALARIQTKPQRTRISGEASQFNHMFFSQAVPAMFATHPPLDARIDRITGGQPVHVRDVSVSTEQPAAEGSSASREFHPLVAGAVAIGRVQQAIASAGDLDAISMDWTRRVLNAIPQSLRDAAHSPQCVRALIAAMLIEDEGTDDAEATGSQLAAVEQLLPAEEVARVAQLRPLLASLETSCRVPLLDMTSPAVHALSDTQSQDLTKLVDALVSADRKISRFEWVVAMLVDAMIDRSGGAQHQASATIRSMHSSIVSLLSIVAITGSADQVSAIGSLQAGCSAIEVPAPQSISSVSLKQLASVVHDLRTLRFNERKRLLAAVVAVVDHDGKTTLAEAEMVRAVSEVMAVPMPPVAPDEAVAESG